MYLHVCQFLCICKPVCLSVCLPTCLPVCLSACLPIWLSIGICLHTSMYVHVSTCLSVFIYLQACLPVCLPTCLSACLSAYLSVDRYIRVHIGMSMYRHVCQFLFICKPVCLCICTVHVTVCMNLSEPVQLHVHKLIHHQYTYAQRDKCPNKAIYFSMSQAALPSFAIHPTRIDRRSISVECSQRHLPTRGQLRPAAMLWQAMVVFNAMLSDCRSATWPLSYLDG